MSSETTFHHSRLFDFPLEKVFAAYTTPDVLQQRRWPKWFTNDFLICEPVSWWKRTYTMIWPNGAKHPNESVFVSVTPEKIVIDHVSKPHYVLTVTLEWEDQKTRMSWAQQFDTPEIYNQIQQFVRNANEENFDRLEWVLRQQ